MSLWHSSKKKKKKSPAAIRSKEGKDIFKGRNGKDGIASRRHSMNKVRKKKKNQECLEKTKKPNHIKM